MTRSNAILVLLCLTFVQSANCDILVVTGQGNTLLPVAKFSSGVSPVNESLISMRSETVEIAQKAPYVAKDEDGSPKMIKGGFFVDATFVMQSHSETYEKRIVAFPIVDEAYRHEMAKSFSVKINGKQLGASHISDVNAYDTDDTWSYDGFIVWEAIWKPKQTLTIECSYYMGDDVSWSSGVVSGWSIGYVVRTGALWRGTIGEAHIQINFLPGKKPLTWKPIDKVGRHKFNSTYPENAKWANENTFQWHFRDWSPKKDLKLDSLFWTGLSLETKHYPFVFALPQPYRGNVKEYDNHTLESLAKRETEPWGLLFEEELAKLNHEKLRSVIAECLHNEMLARNGYGFPLGKAKTEDDVPLPGPWDVISYDGVYYYGNWHHYFMGYQYHGGWYNHDPNLTMESTQSKLNTLEKNNIAFLRKMMAEQLPSK